MPGFQHSVEIAAPPGHVYEFGLDPDNWVRANPGLNDVELVEETDDRLLVDATYDMLVTTMQGEIELSIIEPYSRTVVRFENPGITGEAHYRFSETDTGTEYVQEVDYEARESLLEQIVEPVSKRYVKRQFKSNLENTKDIIEAEVGETTET